MAYTALYRKYRPDRFADVVGQSHITDILTGELKKGKIFHAYLFTGPRGTGKTSCAKILAKAINCENPQSGDACCECESCRRIAAGENLDITEMDAASNRGIADINNIRDQVNYTPAMSKYRVYIVDEVHMLTTEAFNALLKTLEEPPQHIVFILATTEVHKLPATILSRCQRFDFRRIESGVIKDRILNIAEKENIEIEETAAELIASISDGGMRDALSTLDLCSAGGEKITVETVRSACALAGNGYLTDLADSIKNGDVGGALQKIDELYKNSVDMQHLCEELCSHYRNLMIAKTVEHPEKIILCPPDDLAAVVKQAAEYRLTNILLAIRVLGDARARMSNQNRRGELEMAVVKLCHPEINAESDALNERLSKLEERIKNFSFSAQPSVSVTAEYRSAEQSEAPENTVAQKSETVNEKHENRGQNGAESKKTVSAETSPARETEAHIVYEEPKPAAVPPGGIVQVKEWGVILSELKNISPLMAGGLYGSSAYLKGNTILIDCENKIFIDMMREQPQFRDQIKAAIKNVTGRTYGIGPYNKTTAAVSNSEDPLGSIINKLSELEVPTDYNN